MMLSTYSKKLFKRKSIFTRKKSNKYQVLFVNGELFE
jgi:hypothetical protein